MVFSRSGLIAVAMTSAVVSATTSTESDRSLFERANSSTTHEQVQPLFGPRSLVIVSLCGVDLVGGDTWQAQHKEPDFCVTNCLAETGCDAATWTNFNGGTCYFKRVEGSWANSVAKAGAISFMRVETRSQFMDLKPNFPANMDMPGNDVSNVPSPTVDDCNLILWQTTFAAATWTNYQGGTCWLKSKASTYVPSTGATSRYVPKFFNPNKCL